MPNDIIVIVVSNDLGNPGSPVIISSVSDTAGLTWHERDATSSPSLVGYEGNYSAFDTGIWWAYAPSALSSDTITPTFTGDYDCASLIAFGVNGADTSDPWDTNSSLPQLGVNDGGTPADPSVSGMSTDAADTMLLGFMGTGQGDGTDNTYGAGSGYTMVTYQDGYYSCSLDADTAAEYQLVSSAQSNTAASFAPVGDQTNTGWFMIGDAIQEASQPATVGRIIRIVGGTTLVGGVRLE